MKKVKYILIILIFVLGLAGGNYYYNIFLKTNTKFNKDYIFLHIPTSSDQNQLLDSLKNYLTDIPNFIEAAGYKGYLDNIKPGRFKIKNGNNNTEIINSLRSQNIPLKVTFNNIETLNQLFGHISLKIEADNRVFPISNQSQSIIDCLVGTAESLGVRIWTECQVDHIDKQERGFLLGLNNGHEHVADKLVLATGSSRSGYEWARALGHEIINPVPSLFTFKVQDTDLHALSGLALDHAEVYIKGLAKKPLKQSGPVLVTHWGLSGPAIIKLSAWHARELHERDYHVEVVVNTLPGMSDEAVAEAIANYRDQHPLKVVADRPVFEAIPKRLWRYLIKRCDIDESLQWERIRKRDTQKMVDELHRSTHEVCGKGVFKEEFVTAGGVRVDEVDLKTMQSKICPGLHIVGELLNMDGITGGFNFQNAWSSGYLAGNA